MIITATEGLKDHSLLCLASAKKGKKNPLSSYLLTSDCSFSLVNTSTYTIKHNKSSNLTPECVNSPALKFHTWT